MSVSFPPARTGNGSLRIALTDQSSAFPLVAKQALGLQAGDTKLRGVLHGMH